MLALFGLGLGYLLSRAAIARNSKILTAVAFVATLFPWFQHHQLILEHEGATTGATVTGPAVVALMAIGGLFLGGWERVSASCSE